MTCSTIIEGEREIYRKPSRTCWPYEAGCPLKLIAVFSCSRGQRVEHSVVDSPERVPKSLTITKRA